MPVKPSPGSTKKRDLGAGLASILIGPFAFWIKRRWSLGFKMAGLWIVIIGTQWIVAAMLDQKLTEEQASTFFLVTVMVLIALGWTTTVAVVRATASPAKLTTISPPLPIPAKVVIDPNDPIERALARVRLQKQELEEKLKYGRP